MRSLLAAVSFTYNTISFGAIVSAIFIIGGRAGWSSFLRVAVSFLTTMVGVAVSTGAVVFFCLQAKSKPVQQIVKSIFSLVNEMYL